MFTSINQLLYLYGIIIYTASSQTINETSLDNTSAIYLMFDDLPGIQTEEPSSEPIHIVFPSDNVIKPTGNTMIGNAGMQEDLQHECIRECTPQTTPKQCRYHFLIEWYSTMSKACYNCPFNVTDCFRKHCAPADGHERAIVTANRRLPGPLMHVCEGDEVIVDVENDLVSDSTTLHWHGLHMRGTQYMDGVPFLTQCPILAGSSFRYHFIADLPGTHYWHSHSAHQRTDGLFGAFVIRARNDSHKHLYDIDDPKHMFVLTDWMDGLGVAKFVNHHHTEHDNKPYNVLVNGIGKYKALEANGTEEYTPIFEVVVQKGLRYRFRSLANSIQNCPIQISIDNHKLLAIASDGHDIDPIEVSSLTIFSGERWDFIIDAKQPIGTYWMKFRGLLDCDDRFKSAHQVAVLRYEGASGLPGRLEDVDFSSTYRDGLELNKLNAAPGDFSTFLTSADSRSLEGKYDLSKFQGQPDEKFWLDFDFYGIDNHYFHDGDLYPFLKVNQSKRLYMPQINHITLKVPNVPPLSQIEDLDTSMVCNSTTRSDCKQNFCLCTHILKVKLNTLVEIILVDTGIVYWANHPFHLHGNVFAVVAMGRLGEETTLDAVKQLEREGKIKRNLKNPPLKDTVTVPDGGYTVIRFYADNPGFWIFHCHIAFHSEVGMAVVFQVGETTDLPPVPTNFPKCGSWLPPPTENLKQHVAEWKTPKLRLKGIPIKKSINNEIEASEITENKATTGLIVDKMLLCIILFVLMKVT